ncbi:3-hydroxyacyl-[acyl-carrier-protein] dehydratase [Fontibacillus panacisegetis]|uniref:3-hydroxyacyl-[acyl-carrier-protein] dehydratase n=1 Tax=Fontibacillus panacisegetis TaxID=670482 RepID=A0A1G7ETW0_9BACL|nr:3-hydroxyacyl-[acyl-carrier-protein] dehydratase [Fontibacillus panacisegetis]
MIDIQSVIPHRYPFLMIDRILEVEQGKWAKGYKNVTGNEWFISEPNNNMPRMMIVEALAQLGAFALTSSERNLGFLSSLNGIEFLGDAYSGDRIGLYYEVVKSRKGFVLGKGGAIVGDQVIIKAEEIMIYIQGPS